MKIFSLLLIFAVLNVTLNLTMHGHLAARGFGVVHQ